MPLKSPYIYKKFWKNTLSSNYKLSLIKKRHFGKPNRKNQGESIKYGHWKNEKHSQLRSENRVDGFALETLIPTLSLLQKFLWCLFFTLQNVATTVWSFIVTFGGIRNSTRYVLRRPWSISARRKTGPEIVFTSLYITPNLFLNFDWCKLVKLLWLKG